MVHSNDNVTGGAISTDTIMTIDERRKYLRTICVHATWLPDASKNTVSCQIRCK